MSDASFLDDKKEADSDEEILRLKKEIAALKSENLKLREKVSAEEPRDVKFLCLLTKSNMQRLKEMAEYHNTSKNDFINLMLSKIHLNDYYKEEICPMHMGKRFQCGRKKSKCREE